MKGRVEWYPNVARHCRPLPLPARAMQRSKAMVGWTSGTSSRDSNTQDIRMSSGTGETWITTDTGVFKPAQKRKQKMEVDLCLCTKHLWK